MVHIADENETAGRISAWQCIGCGKFEWPGSCIGVCEDRKVEFVYASAYEGANARAVVLLRHSQALEAVVRRLACTTPRKNEWERSYRALQNEARMTLEALSLDSTEGM